MQDQEENNKVESKLNSEIIECDEKNNSNKESNYNSSSENELNKNLKNINNINNKIQLNEYLIYGITGSGKTEIYLQLIEKMLSNNKSSIMLVPEISLTPQTVNRFIERFGEEQIAVLHSKLSIGERYDQWNKIKSGKAKIIIGARSAIFAPAVDLGIIIIDEEHDESYQSEMTPRYDAKEVAEYIANQKDIPLVLGSATPDMKTFYRANQGEIQLLTLTKRANQSILPKVEIIDLREELTSGNKNMISRKLYEEINKNLEMKKQTILFLNRRGFSTFVMCRDCGYTVKCKRCNITMTYHKNENKLKCHYCGYEQDVITECPECHSNNVKYFGAGTQKLEDEVKELFPTASTIRMDVDTVTKKNSHEEILTKFRNENIDILIGTQMVVKGHHFPNVTLVGVIAADGSLNIGDFRANERTFQTLTQVAGRAGRGEDVGRVIIQTYNPDNYAIEYSKSQDYNLFYNTEIEIRKALKYPPFCDIIVIDMSAKSINELRNISKKLHEYLKQRVINEKYGLLLYSPGPSPIDKIKDRIRWRMIIKCKYDDRVNNLLTDMMSEYSKMKVDTARVTVEVNPNNMM
jgi:primosomal protein N' (replication factor Y)